MTRKVPLSGGGSTMPGSTPFGGQTTPREWASCSLSVPPEPEVSLSPSSGASFGSTPGGQLYCCPSGAGWSNLGAWSRILSDDEALCVVNSHGRESRGGDVVVDATLSPPGSDMVVVLNTAEAAGQAVPAAQRVGARLPVQQHGDGPAFVEIRDLPPSEVLVLVNHP